MLSRLSEKLRSLVRNEEGATAVEYGLIVGLIVVVLVVAVGALATALGVTFDNITEILTPPADPAP